MRWVQVVPFQSQVSPKTSVVPTPPKSSTWPLAGSVAMAALPRTGGALGGFRWVQRTETTAARVAGARVTSPSNRATQNNANEVRRVRLERNLVAAVGLGSILSPPR